MRHVLAEAYAATDKDGRSVGDELGRIGYLGSDIRNIGAERIERWFVAEPQGCYAIGPIPRAMVRFARRRTPNDAT